MGLCCSKKHIWCHGFGPGVEVGGCHLGTSLDLQEVQTGDSSARDRGAFLLCQVKLFRFHSWVLNQTLNRCSSAFTHTHVQITWVSVWSSEANQCFLFRNKSTEKILAALFFLFTYFVIQSIEEWDHSFIIIWRYMLHPWRSEISILSSKTESIHQVGHNTLMWGSVMT